MNPEKKEWAEVTCDDCGGTGMVADYGPFGLDFEGPKECPVCTGSGVLWMSPTGRLATHPGGPFRGMAA